MSSLLTASTCEEHTKRSAARVRSSRRGAFRIDLFNGCSRPLSFDGFCPFSPFPLNRVEDGGSEKTKRQPHIHQDNWVAHPSHIYLNSEGRKGSASNVQTYAAIQHARPRRENVLKESSECSYVCRNGLSAIKRAYHSESIILGRKWPSPRKADRIVGSQSCSYDVQAKPTWERCTEANHWNRWNPQVVCPNTKLVGKAITALSYHGVELHNRPAVPIPTAA